MKNSKTKTNDAAEYTQAEKETAKKSKSREIVEFAIPIIIAVIAALLLKTFVFALATVPTGSMLNTIELNDKIFASRLSYVNDSPQRYDIVLFYYPDATQQDIDAHKNIYVKRVIGLPGETVEIVNGAVYVTKTDGETIILDDSFVTNEKPTGNYGPFEVPADSYFMMGDNRNQSHDSRFWKNKYVKKDKIIGKVMFRYFPSISKIE